MKTSAKTAMINQEAAFLDFVERLHKFKKGRRAVHIRLSELRPYNRRGHHLRIAGTTFDSLVNKFEGSIFRLYNDDMVVICNGASVADIDYAVLHLRYLFSEDPLLKSDDEGRIPFCDWYDLEEDGYPALFELARRMVAERKSHETRGAETLDEPKEQTPTIALDPPTLAVIEAAITQADLSTMIRRQPICAVVPGQKPQPVFSEIYTSIEFLRRTLMPDVDIYSNRWLFQDLTRHLDRRVISYLARNDDGLLRESFSINLNVSNLLGPEFLDFDEVLNSGTRSSIVIELQLFDVFADLGNYLFARDFLRERGYRFCLDGATPLSLPLIDREALGFDLVKLLWSADLAEQLAGSRGDELRQAVQDTGAKRMILARCDSEQALEVGRSLGISLYQGYLLDDMLSRDVSRKESIQSMSNAVARNRAASRN